MAHHGQDPLRSGDPEKGREVFRKLVQEAKELEHALGDTGRYPQGALTKDDEGELRFAVGAKDGKVMLDFGKPVAWIGFDADQAIDIAMRLVKEAGRIKGVPMQVRIGRD